MIRLGDRCFAVEPRRHVSFHQTRIQAEVAGVEHAVFDAVIQSQTHKVDVLDGALL